MTAPSKPVTSCNGCPSFLSEKRFGYKALRGEKWCLLTNPGGTVGLPMGEGWRSPFQYDEGEVRE